MDSTGEQEPTGGCFRRTLKVPAAIPTQAGPAVTAQPSTVLGALHGTCLSSLYFILLQMFRKFVPIWRRKTSKTATEDTAEPDSRLSKLQAEPDVSPDLSERSGDSDTLMTKNWAKTPLVSMTEDVAITNTNSGETQGMANTDTTATVIHNATKDFFKKSGVSSQQQVTGLGPGLEASQDLLLTHATLTGSPQSLRPAQCGGDGSTSWGKLGSCSLGPHSKSTPCLPQVPAMVKSIHQKVTSQVTLDARLCTDIVRLAGEHPADVVLTLLHCAPTCDRYGAHVP